MLKLFQDVHILYLYFALVATVLQNGCHAIGSLPWLIKSNMLWFCIHAFTFYFTVASINCVARNMLPRTNCSVTHLCNQLRSHGTISVISAQTAWEQTKWRCVIAKTCFVAVMLNTYGGKHLHHLGSLSSALQSFMSWFSFCLNS